MSRKTTLKLAGFVGALGISAALIAAASSTTGAYFTSTADGSITGGSGHLILNHGVTDLNFADLVPGEYQTQKVGYNIDASTKVDVWMTFDDTTGYCDFTGAKDNPKCTLHDGGLGRYGHFAVANNNQGRFTSYNLAFPKASETSPAVCTVDGNGNGGSNQQSTGVNDAPPYCGVPRAIKLASNLSNGAAGEVEVTFGLTGRADAQGKPVANVGYHLVATQVGVRPDAANY